MIFALAESSLRRARPLLGTIVEITVGEKCPEADAAISAAFGAIALVQSRMSYHDPLSEISRLNHTPPGEAITVTDWTYQVLAIAQQLAEASEGAFDITVAPRLASWGYLPRLPQNNLRQSEASWRDLQLLPGNRVRCNRPLHVDLGGIAKGFAVDRAIDAMREAGVRAGCVNAGGDLRVFGAASWPIHLRHPSHPGSMAVTLPLENAAIATSASYFSRKRWRKCWVCPLVDGRTRLPCDDRVSVSVIAKEAVIADALTKVVLARREGAAGCLQRFHAEAVIVDRQGQCTYVNDLDEA